MASVELTMRDEVARIMKHLFNQTPHLRVHAVKNISSDLSLARVLRIQYSLQDGEIRSSILKTTNYRDTGGVVSKNEFTYEREYHFARSPLYFELGGVIPLPTILATGSLGDKFQLLMEDIGESDHFVWTAQAVQALPPLLARMHAFYLQNMQTIQRTCPWLSQREFATYQHYQDDCLKSVSSRLREPLLADFFTTEACRDLREILENSERFMSEFEGIPQTLIHGDFHIRNVRARQDGSFAIIDWANVGLAPIGCDIASLASMYRVFGGSWTVREDLHENLMKHYAQFLREVTGIDHFQDIEKTVCLWNLTWDLHTRLGPGVTALESGYVTDEKAKRHIAADIIAGCSRALNVYRSSYKA